MALHGLMCRWEWLATSLLYSSFRQHEPCLFLAKRLQQGPHWRIMVDMWSILMHSYLSVHDCAAPGREIPRKAGPRIVVVAAPYSVSPAELATAEA